MTTNRKLKVYGFNYCGRSRRVVAARSMAEALRLVGMGRSGREYGSETGNAEEIALAMQNPGTVWSQSTRGFNQPWIRV